jgi:hypothetical protein
VTILGGLECLAHGGRQVAGDTRNVKRHVEPLLLETGRA